MVDRLISGPLDLMGLISSHSDSVALAGSQHGPGEGLSYRRLAEAAGGWVTRFHDYGLHPGSRLNVQSENSTALVVFLYGTWCAGLLPLILSPLVPVSRVRSLVTELRCGPPFTAGDLDLPSSNMQARTVDPEAPASVLLTSGSTGTTSTVVHTLANHMYSAMGSAANLPIGRDDRWLIALPLSHVAGLSILFRCLLAGATALVARSGSFRENEQNQDDALDLLPQATHLSVVPAQLQRLIKVPKNRRSSLRTVLVGGQATTPTLLEQAKAAGIPVLPTYGSTEMASQVATASPNSVLPTSASGHVLPYRRLRVRDGNIEVSGKTLYAGSLSPDGIDPPFLEPGGWFRTGDCGRLHADGILPITGREDSMFISGGENIQPQEIENLLGSHHEVELAVVVPSPDPVFGTRPVAFIQSRHSFPSVEDLNAMIAHQLPPYMQPVRYLPMPQEGLTPLGKPARTRLTQLACTSVYCHD